MRPQTACAIMRIMLRLIITTHTSTRCVFDKESLTGTCTIDAFNTTNTCTPTHSNGQMANCGTAINWIPVICAASVGSSKQNVLHSASFKIPLNLGKTGTIKSVLSETHLFSLSLAIEHTSTHYSLRPNLSKLAYGKKMRCTKKDKINPKSGIITKKG